MAGGARAGRTPGRRRTRTSKPGEGRARPGRHARSPTPRLAHAAQSDTTRDIASSRIPIRTSTPDADEAGADGATCVHCDSAAGSAKSGPGPTAIGGGKTGSKSVTAIGGGKTGSKSVTGTGGR